MDLQTMKTYRYFHRKYVWRNRMWRYITHNFLKVGLNYGFYLYEEMKALFSKLFSQNSHSKKTQKRPTRNIYVYQDKVMFLLTKPALNNYFEKE